MHFGEYELFPSLIGLSPLPTGHPKTFQRLPVRPFSLCYQTFSLPMGRSLRFRVYHHQLDALFRLAFASAYVPEVLNLAGDEYLVGSLCKRHAVTARSGSDCL